MSQRSALAVLLPAIAAGAGLVDNPIVSSSAPVYLDGEWSATAAPLGLTIPATVPGDLISDLQRAGTIQDPLYEQVWLTNASLWNDNVWTVSTSFTVHPSLLSGAAAAAGAGAGAAGDEQLLVFDGIKMGATISVNGVVLGTATDQFLRYTFPLAAANRAAGGKLLRAGAGSNTLTVTFDPKISCLGRWMACTGGWDWAPYSNDFGVGQPGFARVLSRGIWKSVYTLLVPAGSAAMTHMVPHTFYTGSFPTQPLSNTSFAPFTVSVRVHMWTAAAVTGTMSVSGEWGAASAPVPVTLPAGDSNMTINITATADQVSLWWPAGSYFGGQPMYGVQATFTPSTGGAAAAFTGERRIGFRYFALATANVTDPSVVANYSNADGTDFHGMVFMVNGVAVMSRGANMIPPDEYEGRFNATALQVVVRSAAAANMNTLRVWGGGVFLPDAFYDEADAAGILIYHDLQFAQDGHSPTVSDTEEAEFRHQVRRLSAHPSIVIFDGCNECHVILNTSTGIYATFVLQTVMEEDMSRVLWPSCPSNGWSAGANRLSALPNGSPLGLLPNARPPIAIIPRGAGSAVSLDAQASSEELDAPSTCNYTADMDVQGSNGGTSHAGTSQQDCCAQCYADAQCTSVVYYASTCWLKYGGDPTPSPGRLLCIPTGKPVPKRTIETHGPYQHGSGFPAVNGGATLDLFSPGYPLRYSPAATGLGVENTFASEFGCSVWSSFESTAPTLDPAHWSLHGGGPPSNCTTNGFEHNCTGPNPASQRNYPCDSIVQVYFGPMDFDAVGVKTFQRALWQCMVGQALEMKANIESRRAANQFGLLVWQLNEIWPTGGWGSVEYGPGEGWTQGQVVGGRWKPLHHWYASSLFADVMASCAGSGDCYVKNDRAGVPFTGSLAITQVALADGTTKQLLNQSIAMGAGPGMSYWTKVDVSSIDGRANVLLATVTDSVSGVVQSSNIVLLLPPVNMSGFLPTANVQVSVAQQPNPDGSVSVSVTTDKPALFVTLTTLAQGRFSDNAFLLLPTGPSSPRVITFIPFAGPVDLPLLTSSIRVEHVATYMNN